MSQKKLFAIFGDPVSHSRSPIMHNCVFKNLDYDACYTRVHLKDGSKLRDTFLKLKLSGANITVPHKEQAFKACDIVHGFARHVGVVNTIIYKDDKLQGYNTDADGFMYAIKDFSNIRKILILGAGGTAKALASRFVMDELDVSILNRSAPRLEYFKDLVSTCSTWDDLEVSKYDLVVNTTSAGLNDEELPAPKELIEKILDNTSYVADAIYGKMTPFLKLAKQKNIMYKDGADMLLAQGVLANELFVDSKLKRDDIQKYMSKSFEL
jgi:shikimate dehydrogenase